MKKPEQEKKVDETRDKVLRRMLNMPHKPHKTKTKKKVKKHYAAPE